MRFNARNTINHDFLKTKGKKFEFIENSKKYMQQKK